MSSVSWHVTESDSVTAVCAVYTQSADAETVRVRRLMQSSGRQLLIVDTVVPLRRGRRYRIAFSQYRGVIADDLRGLYRSTYRDKQGQQRYVIK